MPKLHRRTFVASAAAGLVTSTALLKASDESKIKIGLIGCGGRAGSHRDEFQKIAQIAWVCDPDKKRLAEFQQATGAKGTTDMRRVLDDKEVQAVVVSTPDHWHAPASILACKAGKHVYVEKPCSHNFVEGAMLVQAARKNNVVVQHGTQSRSNRQIVQAIQLIREGAFGGYPNRPRVDSLDPFGQHRRENWQASGL